MIAHEVANKSNMNNLSNIFEEIDAVRKKNISLAPRTKEEIKGATYICDISVFSRGRLAT